ncbi:Asp-tRNA(Asn)/Glu-tRNA(Gln) amidotransferase subunit GatC [Sporosarcina thermotolerans]|uniref:Aspartyl/glutamyl-tRNA(Asn/Gln) amidotransferase subunit C n=1 Tax=Sporosarcina thermotolerans TaxID=633404 RepID=A0AAW9ABD4_9BACL|nr:Asp-tRNA(Asn)/Glu-tRNA(Gln) amidotransferase subunit GatC [Sporosarcina thermotolerans]MDW0117908.1 Asp-tRNA(Asn)/Glu-tRNA(Gln) amidotransferase subunit GatC [Sporosarcina thermotolerans]WHT49295.1 Asp-tRNA(Asn)/Glu-tRNA(Gln) amidotransferase subunit GatC [Sporosarcina thermotolerans]
MTKFTQDDVKYFANFAKIGVSDEEAEVFADLISELVVFGDVLKEVETDHIEPMTHPLQLVNVLREDVPQDILDREEMLASVEEHEAGMIKVPNIL